MAVVKARFHRLANWLRQIGSLLLVELQIFPVLSSVVDVVLCIRATSEICESVNDIIDGFREYVMSD